MNKSASNWGCLVAALLIMAALFYVLYARRTPLTLPSFTANASPAPGGPGNSVNPAQSGQEITVQTSETYFSQVDAVRKEWEQDRSHARVRMLDMKPSRKAMQAILSTDERTPRPDLWLSSTGTLVYRVCDVSGEKWINRDDSRLIARFPRQPLAFLVRKSKAAELGEYLNGPNPLPSLPPGRFRYSCADILKSGGGDSATQYLKWAYNRRSNSGQSFAAFLTDLKKRGFVARLEDSGPLAAGFINDGDLDFVLVHNTLADRECQRYPDQLVKMIPATTVFEEPVAVILQPGKERHGDAIMAFLQYIREHIPLTSSNRSVSVGDIGDVNNEKRIWEQVFNNGQRLDNPGR